MTAGFSHTSKTKKNKEITHIDRLMIDTNIVCTLGYALENIKELTETDINEVKGAIKDSKSSEDKQVKELVEKFILKLKASKVDYSMIISL